MDKLNILWTTKKYNNMRVALICLFLVVITSQIKAQEIKSYDLSVKIDVLSKKLHVEGIVSIDFKNRDSISLLLWKNTNIQSIALNQVPVKYSFDTAKPSPILYIPDGGSLIITNPVKSTERQSVFFKYDCNMHGLNGWAKSFTDDWIEINFYCAWFPLGNNSIDCTSKLTITIDDEYKVTGSGIVNKKEGYWELIQPWPSFDNVIIASKKLNSKVLHENNVYVETDYSEFPESAADSIIAECKYAMNFYQNLFGKKDNAYLKFVISPFESGGGYSRKNFISFRTKQFSLYTLGGIGHELAHFWWSNANSVTWEDWLNEAFAEYSMLIYFRERLGNDVFKKQLEDYRNRTKGTHSIWGLDRNAPDAYTVLYEKGALILYEMEQKTGQEQFFKLLNLIATKKVKTTSEFLDLVEITLSKEIRQWIEEKLKTA